VGVELSEERPVLSISLGLLHPKPRSIGYIYYPYRARLGSLRGRGDEGYRESLREHKGNATSIDAGTSATVFLRVISVREDLLEDYSQDCFSFS